MKWVILTVIIAVISVHIYISEKWHNIVCKTFADYYSIREANPNCYFNPDVSSTIPNIIINNGYPIEIHDVTTDDGYILTLFRIKHGRNKSKTRNKPALLMHGIGLNAASFVTTGNKSLAFILADNGYDVWLGNFRGTKFSKHKSLNENDREYWNFSLREHGTYDISAIVNTVYDITKQKIVYVGFSLGTLSLYILGALNETVKDKVEVHVSIAPTVYVQEWKPPSSWLLHVWTLGVNGRCSLNNVCSNYEDYNNIESNSNCWYDVAADSDAITIIQSYGYPVEVHKVTTSDGYILTLFRIPNNRTDVSLRKEPVLLQHGFLYSGAVFVGLGNQSLGLTLAEAGYDVWIANFRGTEYSLEHVSLNSDSIEYWNFNADQLGLNDLPAETKYIYQNTGHSIIYIGHSLGTTAALIYGASKPSEVKSMIKLFVLLSPNGGIKNTKSIFFRGLAPFMKTIVKLFINTEVAKVLAPGTKSVGDFMAESCLSSPVLMKSCIQTLNNIILGPKKHTDASMVPVLFNQFPAGSSLKVLQQITDLTRSDLIAYNYGPIQNFILYGTLTPPLYAVSNIDVPIYLVYSQGDWCTTKKDSELLYNRLSTSARKYGKYEVSEESFNHNDFVYSRNARTLVYNKILNLIDSIRNE